MEFRPKVWMTCPLCGKQSPFPDPDHRERVVFPTMLRKMWSGREVQEWLDENVNKEKANGTNT